MILALILAMATASWPMYQLRPDHEAVLPGAAQAVSWQRRLGGKINGGLAVVGDTIFVESFDGRVTALDATNGHVRWSRAVGGVVMTTPIVADGIVVVGTGTSNTLIEKPSRTIWGRPGGDSIVGLEARNGRILWTQRTIGEDMPSGALVRIGNTDAIVFANGDNHLRALAIRDGRLLWSMPIPGIATMSSAAQSNGRIYVVVGQSAISHRPDELIALDARTLRMLWHAPYGNADCSPTVADGEVFVQGAGAASSPATGATAYNDVAAVDSLTGKLRWRWFSGLGRFTNVGSDERGIAGLDVDGTLYQAIPATSRFTAFENRTGAMRWQIRTDAPVKMSAVKHDGKLYFGDTGHTLYAVDAGTGRIIARRSYPTYFSVSSPVIVGSTLFIANNDTVRAIPLQSLER
ncbi:MAG: outer membrane protein assembly factor BamB family protein [Vulcanimicrobiaceae bacterium]